jgi:hypothetical protein
MNRDHDPPARVGEAAGQAQRARFWSRHRARARVSALIDTRKPTDYDAAVDLLKDLQAIAQPANHREEFIQRYVLLRRQHHRKPSLIARFDRAGLAVAPTGPRSEPPPRL